MVDLCLDIIIHGGCRNGKWKKTSKIPQIHLINLHISTKNTQSERNLSPPVSLQKNLNPN